MTFVPQSYSLDDPDQGKAWERLTGLSLNRVFHDSTYLSPRWVTNGKELADVLGFSSRHICVIQAKALKISQERSNLPASNRLKRLQKDVKHALDQARGAIRNLRLGREITDESYTGRITIPNGQQVSFHGIALIAEMYPALDWIDIAATLLNGSDLEEQIYYHVLDLHILERMAARSSTPSEFNQYLRDRFNLIRASGTALVRLE